MVRTVIPEILDSLDVDDVRALRSRKDLRLINTFMRGQQWILSELDRLVTEDSEIIELGAGSGELISQITHRFPDCAVKAIDLVAKPNAVPESVTWHQGDLFQFDGFTENSIVVANLFVHHLKEDQLERLAILLSQVRGIIFAEPKRAFVPQVMGYFIFPFINDVTRHDMIVSIRAGFVKGELPAFFRNQFQWSESYSVFGGLRAKGVRL